MAVVKYLAAAVGILLVGTSFFPLIGVGVGSEDVGVMLLASFWALWLLGVVAYPIYKKRRSKSTDDVGGNM